MKKSYRTSIFLMAFVSIFLFSFGETSASSDAGTDQNGEIVVIEDGGTGSYSAIVTEDAGLPGMTIYRPKDLTPFAGSKKLPVLLWGNGGCANSTDGHKNFLNEIASHGYIVLGIGPLKRAQGGTPGGGGMGGTNASQLTDALDWIIKQNNSGGNDYSGKIDVSKIAAMGMSCGGLQAIAISGDPRISTTIVCNSGVISGNSSMGGASVTKDDLLKYHNPVLYLIGGPTDIAYNNAKDDFEKVKHVPIAMTNLDVGHGGTYSQPHGGKFTRVALAWLNWQLKGEKEDSKEFIGDNCGLCEDKEWTIETKNF